MTKLKMYDIITEEIDKEVLLDSMRKHIELDYDVRGFKPDVYCTDKMSDLLYHDPFVFRLSFSRIPCVIKDNRIDSNILNTALNKFKDGLIKMGITKETLSGYKFVIQTFHIKLNMDYDYDIDLGSFSLRTLNFNLTDFITKEIKDLITGRRITTEELFSGRVFQNELLLPTVDLDIEKWYNSEMNKLRKVTKRLVKGEVDGITYDIPLNKVIPLINLDDKMFTENENHIHPHFEKELVIPLHDYFILHGVEFNKVMEDILEKGKFYREYVDEISFR